MFSIANIPTTPGSYILWLQLNRKRRISIGRLGEHLLLPGYYAYTGSAFGPGGLNARLGHHLRQSERPRWHIDYLKNIATARAIWFSTEPENREHFWAKALSLCPGAHQPISGFGASDCRCTTHLLCFAGLPDFNRFRSDTPDPGIRRLIIEP